MKKAIIFLVVLLVFGALSSITCVGAGSQNLLLNSDFELIGQDQIPDNWKADFWHPDSTLTVTTKKVHQGKYALQISSDKTSNDARMVQTVKVKPNTYYKLSGWTATENVTPDKIGANLCVMTNTFTNSSSLNNTVDWTYLELNFRTYAGQTEVTVGPRLGMWGNDVQGVAYFDDLSLVELASAPASFQVLVEPSKPNTNTNADTNNSTSAKSSFPTLGLIVVLIIIVLIIVFIIYKKKTKRDTEAVEEIDTVDAVDAVETPEEGKDDGNEVQES
jgi:dolichyl-phosphate-mannose-protein mannosyltransferase